MSIREQLRLDRLPLRLVVLMIGLTGFGVSLAMVIRSNLGVDRWDALHVAVADLTGLSVGTVNIIVAVFVLLLWIPLGQRPGIGTLINAIWIGVSIDFGLWLIPEPPSFTMGLVMLVVARPQRCDLHWHPAWSRAARRHQDRHALPL